MEGGTTTYNILKNLLNGVGSREVFTLNSQLTRKNIIWDWSGNLYTRIVNYMYLEPGWRNHRIGIIDF